MKYQFPVINNIAEVLPLIADKPEFIVAVKDGGYTVINYVVQTGDTFPPVSSEADAILRECRGIIFDTATGVILRRPLHKFFNCEEREETQLNKIDFSAPHTVLTKMDGSMIVPFEVGAGSKMIRFGTKMGITQVALPVEEFVVDHPEYMKFSTWCIENQISPIYEWCSRKQTIVLDYPEDRLVLLACRHMITGEYLPL